MLENYFIKFQSIFVAIPANKTKSTKDDDSPNSSESPEMAIMFMDLNVTENSNLEVFFTCLGPVHIQFSPQVILSNRKVNIF